MNHKQRLGYTVFGAVIMLVGITIGQFITLNIEAQHNGVFDEITCRRLKVVDKAGKKAINLNAAEDANAIIVYDKTGEPAILLGARESENSVFVRYKGGKGTIKLMGTQDTTALFIMDESKTSQVGLVATEDANMIFLKGKAGEESINLLAAEKEGLGIDIVDRAGNPAWSTP